MARPIGSKQRCPRQTCKRGHRFTIHTTYTFGPEQGWRRCRICHALREQQRRNRKKGHV